MLTNALLGGAVVGSFALGVLAAAADRVEVAFTFADPEIVESSGLALNHGNVVTTNDSGDSGRLFVVDPDSGETRFVVTWPGDPVDAEGLAAEGDTLVWVGDIGDNSASRESVQVTPVPVGIDAGDSGPPTYDLAYPDGAVDAESLLVHPATGRVYVASKDVLGGTLFEAPGRLSNTGVNELSAVGPVLPLATDGAFLPDGRHLVLRNYGQAEIYAFPSLEPVASVDLPRQQQGEGIAVDARGRLLLSSEGVNSDMLRVTLPRDVREQVLSPTTSEPSPTQTPDTQSREDTELPQSTRTERPEWPWLLTGLIGVGVIVVLVRSLRPR